MAPRKIRPDQLADLLPGGGLTWLQACSAESASIRDGIVASGGRLEAMTFTGIFVPRLNQLDYIVESGRRAKTFFITPELAKAPGSVEFLPLNYREIISHLSSVKIDAALFMVSPPDEKGICSFGPVADFLPELWRRIPIRIAHINPRMPKTIGYDGIPYSELNAVLEDDAALIGSKPAPQDKVLEAIARNVATIIPDGATIQAGLGRVPEAALGGLRNHRNLRVHSGLIGDSVLELLDAGAVASGASITAGVAIGTDQLYERIRDSAFSFKPAAYTHSQKVMAGLDQFTTINSVVEIDLLGSGFAEHAPEGLSSGPGGASDFAAGAAAGNGRRIVVLTATADRGAITRIVAPGFSPSPVSLTRFNTDYVVTEFGVADLRFKSHAARAVALVGVAAPAHRSALESVWQKWSDKFGRY